MVIPSTKNDNKVTNIELNQEVAECLVVKSLMTANTQNRTQSQHFMVSLSEICMLFFSPTLTSMVCHNMIDIAIGLSKHN
jgi:hypothetical protein